MTQTTWSETDALAPKGPSLAALMLARGAELAGPATAVTEQAEDVADIPAALALVH